MRPLLPPVLVLALLCACAPAEARPSPSSSPPPETAAVTAPETTPAPAPTPEPAPEPSLWGTQTVRTDYRTEDGALLIEVDLSLPFAGALGPGYDAVNACYQGEMARLTAVARKMADYTREAAPDGYPPYLFVTSSPVYHRGPLVCFQVYTEGYQAGAAHPFHRSTSDCFDLETGTRLDLSALFTDWETARSRIEPVLAQQIGQQPDLYENALDLALAALEEVPFFLSPDGLILFYNEYAISAYAFGAFDFLIPAQELADLTAYPIWDWGERAFTAVYPDANGDEFLFVDLRLPRAVAAGPARGAIDAYYAALLEEIRAEYVDPEVPEAKACVKPDHGLPGWAFDFAFTIPLQTDRLVSFRRTSFRCWGNVPEEDQFGEVFFLDTGSRVTFADLFSDADAARERVLNEICAQDAAARKLPDRYAYRDELLREAFDPEAFYLTEEAVVFFYHPYALGDRGHPTYEIPYGALADLWALW